MPRTPGKGAAVIAAVAAFFALPRQPLPQREAAAGQEAGAGTGLFAAEDLVPVPCAVPAA
jgi:hypothetical protein